MKDMDIGLLISSTLHLVIAEVVDIGLLMPATLPLVIAEGVIVVMLVELDLGHNIPATIPITILEQELMLKGEVDIGLIPATLPLITQLNVVYC